MYALYFHWENAVDIYGSARWLLDVVGEEEDRGLGEVVPGGLDA